MAKAKTTSQEGPEGNGQDNGEVCMSQLDRHLFMALNQKVRNKDENKNPDDYLYASLSQPPIKVVDKHNSDDELLWDVECPNCGRVVNYGEQTAMASGHIYCFSEGCRG